MVSGAPGPLGQKHTEVLIRAHETSFTVSSEFARRLAPEVAAMACFGLISVREFDDHIGSTVGRIWRITAEGLTYLERNHA